MQPQTSPTRREARHRDARQAILDAAEALLLQHGSAGVTMRKLAVRCGYTAPTIYHYFTDKQGLLDALLERAFGGLLRHIDRVQPTGDPLEVLRADFHAFVDWSIENPQHFKVLLATEPESESRVPTYEEARSRLEAPLDQLFESGRLHGDLAAIRQSLWAFMYGLISLRISRPDVEWADDVAHVGLEAMLEGFLARTEEA